DSASHPIRRDCCRSRREPMPRLDWDAQVRDAGERLAREWATTDRWRGVRRDYSARDVVKLRGSVTLEHTLARLGAERLWELLRQGEDVAALGALTGNQAVQMVRAGLKAVYLSG